MKTNRRKFSADEKVKIIRRHLIEKVPISEVCDQHGIQPTQFYLVPKIAAKTVHVDVSRRFLSHRRQSLATGRAGGMRKAPKRGRKVSFC